MARPAPFNATGTVAAAPFKGGERSVTASRRRALTAVVTSAGATITTIKSGPVDRGQSRNVQLY